MNIKTCMSHNLKNEQNLIYAKISIETNEWKL